MGVLTSRPLVVASFIGSCVGGSIVLKEHMGGKEFKEDTRADGKVVIVTGANTGIGKETVRELANRGARVYMACRDMNKCEKAREEIVLETKNKYVFCRECDLASQKSIREFADRFKNEENKLDILINNGGVMRCPLKRTKEGIEMQLGVNHMGHFLLTNLLLDTLQKSCPSRIINVSSIAHVRGEINKKDFNSEKSYDPGKAYAQSKLANVMFTRHLSHKLQGTGVTCNSLHPGIVDTEIIRHMSFFNSWIAAIFIKPFVWPFVRTPKRGAQTTLYLALSPDLDGVTGKYFADMEEAQVSELALDEDTTRWLWAVSEKWTHTGLYSQHHTSAPQQA